MNIRVTAKQAFSHPVHILAFGFGSGLAPKAPGTFGTLAAVVLFVLMWQLGVSFKVFAVIVVVSAIAGVYICGESARRLSIGDYGGIVWDEFVGFWVVMLFVPWDWLWVLFAFIAFRTFDIFKPYPIKRFEKVGGLGFGIMIDDILAAFYAILTLLVVRQVLV